MKQFLKEYLGWLALGAGALAVSPAFAYNFGAVWDSTVNTQANVNNGTFTGVWIAPDNDQSIRAVSMNANWQTAVNAAVVSLNATTDFDATYSQGTTCGNQDVCVFYLTAAVNAGLIGWNACWTWGTGTGTNTRCNQSYIFIDNWEPSLPAPPNPDNRPQMRRALMCHEIGHSVGLRHSSEAATTSCMATPLINNHAQALSTHDRNHLTTFY